MSGQALTAYLEREARVAVVPGSPEFFGPGDEGPHPPVLLHLGGLLREAMERIEAVLGKL